MEKRLSQFIELHTKKIAPLTKNAAEAYFNASISGAKSDYKKAAELDLDYQEKKKERIWSKKGDNDDEKFKRTKRKIANRKAGMQNADMLTARNISKLRRDSLRSEIREELDIPSDSSLPKLIRHMKELQQELKNEKDEEIRDYIEQDIFDLAQIIKKRKGA